MSGGTALLAAGWKGLDTLVLADADQRPCARYGARVGGTDDEHLWPLGERPRPTVRTSAGTVRHGRRAFDGWNHGGTMTPTTAVSMRGEQTARGYPTALMGPIVVDRRSTRHPV